MADAKRWRAHGVRMTAVSGGSAGRYEISKNLRIGGLSAIVARASLASGRGLRGAEISRGVRAWTWLDRKVAA
jgi:hypothetical protein